MKNFRRIISVILTIFIAITVMPLTAFAWDNGMTFVKKTDSWNGYDGKYSAYVHNGKNYAGIVLKEVDNNGVITIHKGSNFSITLSCGTWVNDEANNGVLPTNNLTWHYGSYSEHHTIISADGTKNPGNSRWSAYINRDSSKEVQSSITGEFATGSCKGGSSSYSGYDRASDYFRANERDGAIHEAYGIFNFTDVSLPQINTPGVYTLYLAPTIALNNWKYNNGNSWNTIYGWGRFDYDKNDWDNRTIPITLRVVEDYSFKDINGNIIKNVSAAGEKEALAQMPANTPATSPIPYLSGSHTYTSYTWSNNSVRKVFNEIATPVTENCKYGSWIVDIPATCGSIGRRHRVCSICGSTESATISYDYTNHRYGDWVYSGNNEHTRTCKYSVYHIETEPCNIDFGECTVCGHIYADSSAFINAVEEYNSIVANKEIYIEASFNEYVSVLQNYLYERYNTQEEFDNATRAIISAKALLKEKIVSISFSIVDEELNILSQNDYSTEYGNQISLDANNKNVSKWVLSTVGVNNQLEDTIIDFGKSKVDILATKSSRIIAYTTDDIPVQNESVKVTFYSKGDTATNVKYVDKAESYSIDDLSKGVDNACVPFYTFEGWEITNITDTEITVRAKLKINAQEEEKCTIHFNGKAYTYGYGKFVYLGKEAEGKSYALSTTGNASGIVEYINGTSFLAPYIHNVYVIRV